MNGIPSSNLVKLRLFLRPGIHVFGMKVTIRDVRLPLTGLQVSNSLGAQTEGHIMRGNASLRESARQQSNQADRRRQHRKLSKCSTRHDARPRVEVASAPRMRENFRRLF